MAKLTVEHLKKIEEEENVRKEDLKVLLSCPFTLSSQYHSKSLKIYVDNFELSVNQMYLFQAMSSGIATYLSSFLIGNIFLESAFQSNHHMKYQ